MVTSEFYFFKNSSKQLKVHVFLITKRESEFTEINKLEGSNLKPQKHSEKKNVLKYSIDRLDYVEYKLISLFLLLHFWHTDINEKTIRFHFPYLKLKKEDNFFSKLRVPQGFIIGWDHFVVFISDLFLFISEAKIPNTLHDN